MTTLAIGDVVMVGERQSDIDLDFFRGWPQGRLGVMVGPNQVTPEFPYYVELDDFGCVEAFMGSELVRIGRL